MCYNLFMMTPNENDSPTMATIAADQRHLLHAVETLIQGQNSLREDVRSLTVGQDTLNGVVKALTVGQDTLSEAVIALTARQDSLSGYVIALTARQDSLSGYVKALAADVNQLREFAKEQKSLNSKFESFMVETSHKLNGLRDDIAMVKGGHAVSAMRHNSALIADELDCRLIEELPQGSSLHLRRLPQTTGKPAAKWIVSGMPIW